MDEATLERLREAARNLPARSGKTNPPLVATKSVPGPAASAEVSPSSSSVATPVNGVIPRQSVKQKAEARRMDVMQTLREEGLDPLRELIRIYREEALGPAWLELRVKMMQDLLQYQVPKLKTVEHTGGVENSVTIQIVRFGDNAVLDLPSAKVGESSPRMIEGAA